MSFYPPKINGRFVAVQNAGIVADADAVGAGVGFVCGTFVRFYLKIDAETKEIKRAKYASNSCGYAIAAADYLAEIVVGRKLTEFHGLDAKVLRGRIAAEFGEFDEFRAHCPLISIDALQNALADFRRRQLDEYKGEQALICTCFGISEEIVEAVIAEKHCETVESVTEMCSAGGGCGSCRFLIQELIDTAADETYVI